MRGKFICSLLGIILLTGCNTPAPSSQPELPESSAATEEAARDQEYSSPMSSTITSDNTQYISDSNGASWLSDGKECTAPPLYLSLSGSIAALHCTVSEPLKGSISATLSQWDGATWAEVDCPGMLKVPDDIFETECMFAGSVLELFLDGAKLSNGLYRLTAGLAGNECCVEFTVPAEHIDSDIRLITIMPEGNEYTSADFGMTWACGELNIETPPIYLAPLSDADISFSGEPVTATLYNISAGQCTGSLYSGELTRLENGEWIPAGRISGDLPHSDIKKGFSDGLGYDISINLGAYQPIEGKYRYTMQFGGYTMIVEFYALP